MVAEQRIPLSFRRDDELVVAVIWNCPGVCEVLVIGLILVYVVEIMRKVSVVDRR